ncbi:MAG: stress response translation initiation inhibitor YciH [Pseudomonadales bacterium]
MAACVCAKKHPVVAAAGDGIVRLHRETKGRKGAGVTLVRGLPGDEALLKDLAKRLKAACGVGGAVKEGVIELQGEQRQKIKPLLEAAGYVVKIAGG